MKFQNVENVENVKNWEIFAELQCVSDFFILRFSFIVFGVISKVSDIKNL